MKKLFAVKNETDRVVRKITSLSLCIALLFAGTAFLFFGEASPQDDLSEYKEPFIRVGLALRESELTSTSFFSETGFKFGYMDKSSDTFTALGDIYKMSLTALTDDSYYVEVTSYSNGDVTGALTDPAVFSELKTFFSGYGLELIPAYHNGFCYRIGPFRTLEEAKSILDVCMTDIETSNQMGALITMNASVVSPLHSSVLLQEQDGGPVYSFASDDDTIGAAVKALPDENGEDMNISWGSWFYPNVLEFRRCFSGGYDALSVVNTLPLETYVGCVDSSEIYASWPLETHKIFSVVVRTFTMRAGERHATSYCDLCSDVDCQAYKGISRVTDKIREAVESTTGLVLSYENKLARCYYYAVSGGSTVNGEECWVEDLPYLKAVPTPWERYKDYGIYTSSSVWHKEFTGQELYRLLKNSGKHPALKGEIVDVHIDRFCTNSCFVYQVTYTDVYGNKSVAQKSDTIRHQLGLNSGNFVVGKNGQTVTYPEYSLDCYPSLYSEEYNGFEDYVSYDQVSLSALLGDLSTVPIDRRSVSVLFSNGKTCTGLGTGTVEILTSGQSAKINEKGLPDILNGTPVLTWKTMKLSGAEGKFIFEGRGWGHGIGFSQYGIWDLCLMGYDFETVLKYYLKGVEIVNLGELEL